jgi:tRNA-(ms[2]io[6]A)-hydroxylase
VEELSHYREVVRLLIERGVKPGADQRDPYIRALNSQIRQGSEAYLLDRLLIGAIVERRGGERFGLIAEALSNTGTAQPGPEAQSLASFYRAISASESRHWQLFIDLARTHCPEGEITPRLEQLIAAETRIMLEQPYRPALH